METINNPSMQTPTPITNDTTKEIKSEEMEQLPVFDEPEEEAPPKTPRTPEQEELIKLMSSDKKFVAIRQIMECRNRVNEAKAIKEAATSKISALIPDDKFAILESRAVTLDDTAIANLDMHKDEDWSKVLEVYTFEDGSKIHFSDEPDTKDFKWREMHRDFLLYIKKVKVETEKYNEFESKIMDEIDDLYKQLDEVLGEEEANKIRNYATFADYYREWIAETLKRDDISDTVRNQIRKTLEADDRGIYLDFLKKEISGLISRKGNAKSILYGFNNNFMNTAETASKILERKFSKYRYHIAFNKFYDIETRTLGFTEEKYNNLFMFLLFRFIRHNYERFDNFWMITIGEVLTQLGFLFKPKEDRPASSEIFEKNIREVLSMVID